jgi:S-DNA-T family DNA segregation ATPase FtsK/SpoIIIE
MASKKKNTVPAQAAGDNYFLMSLEKKRKLIGLFMAVFALLLFLSIISYSAYDEANLSFEFSDLFKAFSSDPDFADKADSARNWLGVFGAYVSDFFVNNILGYFSLIFPVIIFLWGYAIVREQNYRLSLYISNFLLAAGLTLASFFGVIKYEFGVLTYSNELSGNVGNYIGAALARLLGGLGAIIFLATMAFVILFITFDIKVRAILDFIKRFFTDATEAAMEKWESAKDEKSAENLAKIKELGKDKKPVPKKAEKKIEAKEEDEEIEIEEPEDEQVKEPEIKIVRNKAVEALPVIAAAEDEEIPVKKEDDGERDFLLDKEAESKSPDQWNEQIKFVKPSLSLLETSPDEDIKVADEELKRNGDLLKEKLKLFDIDIVDITVIPGPVVTLYEIVPAPGVKISRIVGLENDIALALAARGIRIIAPIPGKSAIGVEIPNAVPAMVKARSVLANIGEGKEELPLALGKTISGEVYVADLAKMPHMLIAGSTGSGKSVGINMIISSLLYSKQPSEVKFVIIDPKKIELSFYKRLSKHYLAVSPDLEEEIITNPSNAVLILKSVEIEMEKRYNKLAKVGSRNIVEYNAKVNNPKTKPKDTDEMQHYWLPYIVVIIDELADLMLTAGKEVEEPITRLAQMSRAVGIHLVLATQRPSVNVITGVIKANFPARIAYQVATKIDSRTILDMNGAEQLLGRGDMLFLPAGTPKPIRIQNAYISTEEVEAVTNSIYVQQGYSKRFFLPSLQTRNEAAGGFLVDLDPMFEEAARVIVRHQQGSVSLLQRRLKLGYSRAARIVDQLEQAGIVGPAEGSKAREVIVESEQQLDTILKAL